MFTIDVTKSRRDVLFDEKLFPKNFKEILQIFFDHIRNNLTKYCNKWQGKLQILIFVYLKKQPLTIFQRLNMMLIIDIRKKVAGTFFRKEKFMWEIGVNPPIFHIFLPISQKRLREFFWNFAFCLQLILGTKLQDRFFRRKVSCNVLSPL